MEKRPAIYKHATSSGLCVGVGKLRPVKRESDKFNVGLANNIDIGGFRTESETDRLNSTHGLVRIAGTGPEGPSVGGPTDFGAGGGGGGPGPEAE